MEPKLHAGRFKKVLLKGVEDGLVVLAHVERDKVSLTVVPHCHGPQHVGMDLCVGSPDGGKCRARIHLVGASPRQRIWSISGCCSKEMDGRVGVGERYPLGSLGPLEYLAIPQRQNDVFGRDG